MKLTPREACVVLLAGSSVFAVAAPASASTAVYRTDTNVLEITVDGTPASDKLTCAGGKVKLNGADPTRVPADGKIETGCEASVGLKANEPDKTTATANTLDLRGVTRAEWTGLAGKPSLEITMGGGDDTVFGTEFADTITPGNGADTVNGDDGDDTMIWNPGEASDIMTGGDGRDTVVDNGGPGPEQFVIRPKAGDPSRVDASRINNPFTLDIDAEKFVVNGNGGDDTISGSAGVARLITTEINGGDGNDVLVGTDGNDALNGSAGNDSISGAAGNDQMSGDDGDDTLIWNPGDGSDRFEGGAGTDVAQDNGGAVGEHFVVSANGQRVTATRDNAVPFFLDIGTSETLDLNAAGGNDSVDVNAGLGTAIKVDIDLGDGNDAVAASNDSSQMIDGGPGLDTGLIDATDRVTNLEKITGNDTSKPKIGFVSKQLRVVRGKAILKLRCRGESTCTGTVRLVVARKVVGSAAIKLAGEKARTYRIALKASGRRARTATVKVRVKDPAGNTGVATKKLRLKR